MTKPWYHAAFGADYLERYAHRDDREAVRAIGTLLERTVLPPGARVLELCCGAGRHAAVMSRHGFDVTGLDLSMDLLREASAADPARVGRTSSFVRGDKRHLPFAGQSFDMATHFFTAFGYFESDAENFGVFGEVARVLRPGGWYLFDFLSAPRVLAEFEGRSEIHGSDRHGTCCHVESMKRLTDGGSRVEKRMRIVRGGGPACELVERVRLFQPGELRDALQRAGFVLVESWGDYSGAPYEAESSPRWIALCRRT
ncbi:class I SAM-dependent methyltransferase [Candidatus Poribacteria bacterium]|nr:class I SAM-dependent methyltransferase [Candidatus Poribacteria bacterium]